MHLRFLASLASCSLIASTASATPTRSEACPGVRYLGVSSGGCREPAIGSEWSGGALFDPAQTPSALHPYCLYSWEGSGPPDPTLLPTDSSGRPPSDWLESDCHVVAPLGHPLTSTFAPTDAATFELQTDPVNGTASSLVRIDIVDTAGTSRDGSPGGGLYRHGRAMGLIAKTLTMATAPEIHHTLALPLEATPSNRVSLGGFVGDFADLSRALVEAVNAARTDSRGPKLILNLSIGWSARWGPLPHLANHGPNAVLDALRFASCEGALIVAAAGNAGHGPTASIGPTYPAAWADEPAPDATACGTDYRMSSGPAPAAGLFRPLVFAVSGVDGRDEALVNARPGALARLVAPGQLGRVSDPDGGHTLPLTGSSVAAAVASSAAALVWQELPSYSAHQVMEVVSAGAVQLGSRAEFGLGTGGFQRRVSLCGAVTEAKQLLGSTPPYCAMRPAGIDIRPPAVLLPLTTPAYRHSATSFTRNYLDPTCGVRVYEGSSAALDPCPLASVETPEELPWIGALPSYPDCAVCALQRSNRLAIIALDADSTEIAYPVVHAIFESGGEAFLDLGSIGLTELKPGETYLLEDLDSALDVADISKMSIEGTDASGKLGVSAPMTVNP